MKKRLVIRGIVATRSEATGLLNSAGDAVIIKRNSPRWLLLQCPCGCGEEFPINLDPRSGPAWRLYMKSQSDVSVFPSVWRDTGCKSHYIIWHGDIFLFSLYEGYSWDDEVPLKEDRIQGEILTTLRNSAFIHFSEIAALVDAVPWDVLSICRKLVRQGFLSEGNGDKRGYFARL